jgi:Fe-S cluster assembly ATP-binding protein
MLKIKKITAVSETQPLLNNVSLEVKPGEIHAVMGPKHSGKSALAHVIAGHPSIQVTDGSISWKRKKLESVEPDERFKSGIFVGFQYPPEFESLTNWELVKELFGNSTDESVLRIKYEACCELLGLGLDHSDRTSSSAFLTMSHAKRNELIHMILAEPKLILLDEIDEGLSESDVLMVGSLLKNFLESGEIGSIVITHNKALLEILNPTHVHVMVGGEIKLSGTTELYTRIIEDGYSEFS